MSIRKAAFEEALLIAQYVQKRAPRDGAEAERGHHWYFWKLDMYNIHVITRP